MNQEMIDRETQNNKSMINKIINSIKSSLIYAKNNTQLESLKNEIEELKETVMLIDDANLLEYLNTLTQLADNIRFGTPSVPSDIKQSRKRLRSSNTRLCWSFN